MFWAARGSLGLNSVLCDVVRQHECKLTVAALIVAASTGPAAGAQGVSASELSASNGSAAFLSVNGGFDRPVLRPNARRAAVLLPSKRPKRRPGMESTVFDEVERQTLFPFVAMSLSRPQRRRIPETSTAAHQTAWNTDSYMPGLRLSAEAADSSFWVEPLRVSRPKRRPASLRELECLAQAIYFEARGESDAGRHAVAEAILNRVESEYYPDTVCEVIAQGVGMLHRCQFSYNCDGKAEIIHEKETYREIKDLARAIRQGNPFKLTNGATHFHTVDVSPSWASEFHMTASIGRHVFYREVR